MIPRIVTRTTIILTVSTIICAVLFYLCNMDFFLTMAITLGTIWYHFVMRLVVGKLVNVFAAGGLDYNNIWFRQKEFEPRLYKMLRVKRWKDKMPTYKPQDFVIREHSPQEIINTMCISELVHEVIIVCSFIPIVFSKVWGAFWVFVLTSVAAAVFDLIFVILQRYNRPRVVKVLDSKHNK